MARWRSPDGKSRRKTFRRKEDAKRHLTSVESQKLAGTYIDTLGAQLRLSDWWQTYDLEVPRRATTAARDRVVMG
jgi:hypothetical protein